MHSSPWLHSCKVYGHKSYLPTKRNDSSIPRWTLAGLPRGVQCKQFCCWTVASTLKQPEPQEMAPTCNLKSQHWEAKTRAPWVWGQPGCTMRLPQKTDKAAISKATSGSRENIPSRALQWKLLSCFYIHISNNSLSKRTASLSLSNTDSFLCTIYSFHVCVWFWNPAHSTGQAAVQSQQLLVSSSAASPGFQAVSRVI